MKKLNLLNSSLLISIIALTMLISCSRNSIEGPYVIKEINKVNGEILTGQLGVNVFVFKPNGKCRLPLINFQGDNNYMYEFTHEDSLKLYKSGDCSTIWCNTYKVSTLTSKSNYHLIKLESDELEVLLEKNVLNIR